MSRTATAAVAPSQGAPFTLTEVTLDDPRPDEVVVRMVAAGLCHTDLSVRDGLLPARFPVVLGHEGAGVVEEVGSQVTAVAPGDRVLLSFTSCGRCRNCVDGHPAYCDTWLPRNLLGGARMDGSATIRSGGEDVSGHFFGQSSFATYALADERSLVKVPDDAPLDLLAPLGCGIQTGAGTVLNVLRPEPGSTLAVFGAGTVGLAAVMAAALRGLSRIVAVDVVPARLSLALELGATDAVDARGGDVAAALRELTGGAGVDFAVEASGNLAALSAAVDALALRGTCAVVGAPPFGSTIPLDVNAMLGGKRIVGVTEGDANPPVFVPVLADLVTRGMLKLDRLVERFAFADIEKAADAASRGESLKPVLTFE
ncbi:NAD(P)-dependent alcohol dehydrogenase [Phytohabitans rumicis]|uniref:Alcohol dehydrogenase n=1 Tax=Phytohabitans rumicis TaxID=1076125 RepID=A0A6V8LLU8_9ACTN|nr:NAD(P)-dependent alcohol dehydrogenase [Phytohabitans rumicis]GFJ95067.1 alcohol dehydrogenase [Phytohabitans rumicis]